MSEDFLSLKSKIDFFPRNNVMSNRGKTSGNERGMIDIYFKKLVFSIAAGTVNEEIPDNMYLMSFFLVCYS